MAQTSYFVPNIHVNGDLYKGRNCLSRLFSSKEEDVAAAGYEARVIKFIDTLLWGTWTGTRLLQAIKACAGKKVTISPFTEADVKELGLHNAYAAPTDDADADARGLYSFQNDDPTTSRDERWDLKDVEGTGKGSDVEIHFTAELLDPKRYPGAGPQEVLLHELVHTLRDMRGTRYAYPTEGGARVYDDQEEFLAVLVTNIYMSECYGVNMKLRYGHSRGVLPASQSTSTGFLSDKDNLYWVRWLAGQEGDLFGSLASVTQAPFNPIAEFWNNRYTKYQ
jgi:hypothetical protein